MNNTVCTDSSRAMCGSLARYRDPHLQRPTIKSQKFIYPNLIIDNVMSLAECFAGILNGRCSKYGRILGITLISVYGVGLRRGLLGMPMGAQA